MSRTSMGLLAAFLHAHGCSLCCRHALAERVAAQRVATAGRARQSRALLEAHLSHYARFNRHTDSDMPRKSVVPDDKQRPGAPASSTRPKVATTTGAVQTAMLLSDDDDDEGGDAADALCADYGVGAFAPAAVVNVHSSALRNSSVLSETEVLRQNERVLGRLRDLYDSYADLLKQQYRYSRAKYHANLARLLGVEKMTPALMQALAEHLPPYKSSSCGEMQLMHDKSTMYTEHRRARQVHALARYGRKRGRDVLLSWQAWRSRMRHAETNTDDASSGRICAYILDNEVETTSTTTCKGEPLPYSKYCAQHITHDTHQMLFRACCDDTVRSDGQHCQRAVLPFDSPLLSDTSGDNIGPSFCQLHKYNLLDITE